MIARTLWTVGILVTGVGVVAAGEAPVADPAEPAGPMTSIGCSAPAMTPARLDDPMAGAVPLTGGSKVDGGGGGQLACCYSDPCPGWGSYKVSCCEEGCSAWSDRVWCHSTGFIYCPDPCADNGICNTSCGSDPDCTCQCNAGASCSSDDECCGQEGFGFCDKEPWEIVGSCACYF